MDRTVVFGDVFAYKDDEYVYFAEDPENGVIFAGKILNPAFTRTLIRLEKTKTGAGVELHDSPAFSYVVLSTSEFGKRAVICGSPESSVSLRMPHATLNEDDKTKIKEEIIAGPAPDRLTQLLELLG